MPKLIILDFDGVLSDSFESLYGVNKESAEHIGKTLSPEDYRQCFFGSLHKELQKKLGLTDEENQKFLEYKLSIFSSFYNPDKTKLFTHAENLVKQLDSLGRLYIVSSAPENVIRQMLKEKNLEQYFVQISGINKLGKTKTFEAILEKESKKPEEVFFVTDTVGDMKESVKMGFKTIAVTWGFHTREDLQKEHPSCLAETPEEVVNYIQC